MRLLLELALAILAIVGWIGAIRITCFALHLHQVVESQRVMLRDATLALVDARAALAASRGTRYPVAQETPRAN
jgi:hypothetical protein